MTPLGVKFCKNHVLSRMRSKTKKIFKFIILPVSKLRWWMCEWVNQWITYQCFLFFFSHWYRLSSGTILYPCIGFIVKIYKKKYYLVFKTIDLKLIGYWRALLFLFYCTWLICLQKYGLFYLIMYLSFRNGKKLLLQPRKNMKKLWRNTKPVVEGE